MNGIQDTLLSFLGGAILMVAWTISLLFALCWRKCRDRFFAFFSLAFLLLGIERIGIVISEKESLRGVYLFRLFAFLVILFAILDKNRARPDSSAGHEPIECEGRQTRQGKPG